MLLPTICLWLLAIHRSFGVETSNITKSTTLAETSSRVEDATTSSKPTVAVTEAYNNNTMEIEDSSRRQETENVSNSNTDASAVTTVGTANSDPTPTVPVFGTKTENAMTTSGGGSNVETTTESGFIDILGSFDNDDETKTSTTSTINPPIETAANKTRREKLSEQIRAVIRHYKKYGTVTIPDASIPDPMSLPNMKKSFSGMEMTFTNQKVYGLSNYTVEHINTDLDKMQVFVAIYMKKMTILGNYSANVWFRKVAGPFNVTLLYVEASGAAALVRDAEGNLQASESEMDMTFLDSKVKFGNMGIMGSLLQGVAASAGPVLFEAVKPVILNEINNRVREDVNKKIKTIGTKFAETGNTPPLELAIQEARKYVKENGYDPYKVDNYVLNYMANNESMFKINISYLMLTGLSNFRRIGEVSLSMDSGTIQMGLHLATTKLKGMCRWSVSIGKSFERLGHTNFTVDYIQGRGIINQSLDVSQHPVLEDIDVNVGKVKIQTRGTGALDILLEAIVNTLPDIIRHVIVDAIELPLKFAIQHLLSEVNVEELLDKKLPELDKAGL